MMPVVMDILENSTVPNTSIHSLVEQLLDVAQQAAVHTGKINKYNNYIVSR